MMDHLATALFLSLPLVFSGALHMVFVRKDWLSALRRPIDERRFGPNKTWRGFVVMPLATVVGVWLMQALEPLVISRPTVSLRGASGVVLGLGLGLAYVLAELPNSLIKRRLGIEPGMLPEKNRLLFAFVDQADSAIGCAIAYRLLLGVPTPTVLAICLLGPALHLVGNVVLYLVGVRRRPV
jgi:CDP-diacylglycerol--serine O-phosphatidyltransferase